MKNLFKARWMTSLIFLIALFVITGIAAPGFLTYDNIVTCFNTATMYTLLADVEGTVQQCHQRSV